MRIEKDFIGSVNIPFDALYGIQSYRGAENSAISGRKIGDEFELVRSIAEIKLASSRANLELGVINEDQQRAISIACREVIDGQHNHEFIVDILEGSGATSINMNVNEVIANLAMKLSDNIEIHPNDHVNISQSTNDVIPSAIKIAAYRLSESLISSLGSLHASLLKKEKEFADLLHLGRTCLQDAQPMTLGQVFSGYASMVKRQLDSINHSRSALLSLPLGGTAIGTGLGAPDGYLPVIYRQLQDVTSLTVKPSENLFDAMQNADTFARFSAELKVAAVSISKIASDLIILSSGPNGGFAELTLPSVQAGSSIMPGKVNPVLPQMMCQVGFAIAGNDTCIAMATQQGQLEINAYEPVTASRLFDSIRLLDNGCRLFAEKCISGIKANSQQNEANLFGSSAISTAFVRSLGYAQVSQLVQKSHATGKTFAELVIDQGLLDEELYDQILRDSTKSP